MGKLVQVYMHDIYTMETKPKRSCEIRRNEDEEVKESIRKDETNYIAS